MWYLNKLHKIFNFHASTLFSHLPNVKKKKKCGVFLIYNNVKLKKCEWVIKYYNVLCYRNINKFIQIIFFIYHFSFQSNKKKFQPWKTKIYFIPYFFISLSIFYLSPFYTPTKQSLREPLLLCKIGGNCYESDLRYWRRSISL